MSGEAQTWVYRIFLQLPFGYAIIKVKDEFNHLFRFPRWVLWRKTEIKHPKYGRVTREQYLWPKLKETK